MRIINQMVSVLNLYFILDDTKTFVESIYSSELNNKSPKQGHENCRQLQYYYEAIKIKVNTSDYYILSCISTLDTFGYLYKYPFDPYNSVNKPLIKNDDYLYEDENFVINFYLHFNITYVLMVTTSYESQINLQGPFSVIVKGPDKVDMKQIGMYIYNTLLLLLLLSAVYFCYLRYLSNSKFSNIICIKIDQNYFPGR